MKNGAARVLAVTAVIVVLCLGFAGRAGAGVNQWTANGPVGGAIIVVSPNYATDHTVFAGSSGNSYYSPNIYATLFRTTDAGASWTPLLNGLPSRLNEWTDIDQACLDNCNFNCDMNPSPPPNCYNDCTASCTVNHSEFYYDDITAIAISPDYVNDHTVFVSVDPIWGNGGVYKSTDGGASWGAVNTGITDPYISSLAVSPNYATDQTVYAGTSGGGVFKSTDGGTSWTTVNTGLTYTGINGLAVSPNYATDNTVYAGTTGGGVFKTTNGGTCWTAVNTGITDAYAYISSLVISSNYATDQIVYAGVWERGVFKTTNGGASWTAVNTGITNLHIKSLSISPNYAADHTVFAGAESVGTESGGVYKTTNAGTSWIAINTGMPPSTNIRALAASPDYAVDLTVYAGTGNGVFSYTTDDTTAPVSTITAPANGATLDGAVCTITGTADDGTGSGVQKVEVSTDGGATWKDLADGVTDTSGNGSWSTWSYTWVLPADGSYTIQSRATDNAGNVETPVAGVTVTVDKTAPTVSAGANQTKNAQFTQTATAADATSMTYSWTKQSGSGTITFGSPTALSTTISASADGTYTLRFTATDAAGNSTYSDMTLVWDTTAPVGEWTRQMGTTMLDYAGGVSVDPNGDVYVAGTTMGALDGQRNVGGNDIFLVKYNASGVKQWTRQIGTVAEDYGSDVAADGSGNVYVAGSTNGGLDGNISAGQRDFYVVKYNSNGVKQWTRQMGTTSSDYGYGVSVDGCGNVYVTGLTGGGLDGNTNAGDADLFVVKYDADGVKQWTRQMGTATTDRAWDVSVDGSGNVYVAGVTSGGLDGNTSAGGSDFFVVKYDSSGVKQWTRQMGTSATDWATDVSADSNEGVYVAGYTNGGLDGNTNAGSYDLFVVKYNTDGVKQWTRQMGTATSDFAYGVSVDGSGNVYVTGSTEGGLDGNANAGGDDLFIVKYNTDGVKLWTRQMGTATGDSALGVCAYGSDGIYVAGSTSGGLDGNTNAGWEDLFVAKLAADPAISISTATGYTSSTLVTLDISISDPSGVSEMQISNDGTFDTEPWEAHATSKDWTLDTGDGLKTVYASFKDTLGNVSGVYSDTIVLDTTGPSAAINYPSYIAVRGISHTFTGTADDGTGSGVQTVEVSTDGGTTWKGPADGVTDTSGNGSWSTWSYTWPLPADGTYDIQARATDNAGNVGPSSEAATLFVDNTCPSSSITAPADGISITSPYVITGTGTDATSGVRKVEVQITNTGTGETVLPWTQVLGTFSWDYTWTIPSTGSYNIQTRATDYAGNVETPGAGVNVTVVKYIVLDRDTVNITYTLGSPPASATVDVTSSIGSLNVTAASGSPWLMVSPSSGITPKTLTLTVNPPDQSPGFITGTATVGSPLAGNSPRTITVNVTIAPYTTPELQHSYWDGSFNNGCCGTCHAPAETFLPSGYRRDMPGFCYSCHNPASVAHDSTLQGNHGHSILVNATAFKRPTYGNITAAQYNDQPFSRLKDGDKVICVTCHNAMNKTEDYGRVWEMTATSDQKTYYLERGGWSGYGYLVPKVYRSTGLTSAPALSRARTDYLAAPSEYTYDETAGTITFNTAQSSSSYIYVTLDYPYLRASSEGNRLCSDCHTEATHKGNNCLACHQSHNTDNIAGIGGKVRTADRSEKTVKFLRYTGANSFADGGPTRDGICEVCHTTTKYYRNNTTAFANHSGGFNYDGKDCTSCHSHTAGFAR